MCGVCVHVCVYLSPFCALNTCSLSTCIFVCTCVVVCVRACMRVPVSVLRVEHLLSEYLYLCVNVWCVRACLRVPVLGSAMWYTCVRVCVYLSPFCVLNTCSLSTFRAAAVLVRCPGRGYTNVPRRSSNVVLSLFSVPLNPNVTLAPSPNCTVAICNVIKTVTILRSA